MSLKQLLIGTLVIGIVANIFDTAMFGFALQSTLKSIEGVRSDPSQIPWYIVGDFFAALVFTWFYGLVRGSFSSGLKYGLAVGVVVAFPTWLMTGMMIKGWPYWLSWFSVAYSIIWCGILGWVLAMLMNRLAPKRA